MLQTEADEADFYEEQDDDNLKDEGKMQLNKNEHLFQNFEKLQSVRTATADETGLQASQIPSNFVFTVNINHNSGEQIQSSHTIASSNHVNDEIKTESLISDLDLEIFLYN